MSLLLEEATGHPVPLPCLFASSGVETTEVAGVRRVVVVVYVSGLK